MWCGIISLFPAMFSTIATYGMTRRALEQGLLRLDYWDPRAFSTDAYQSVDDRPYGGGPGMVMGVEPLRSAIQAARQASDGKARVIYMSPQGRLFTHRQARHYATQDAQYIFVAGRYEGIDERLLALEIDEEWSIGDYVLSGGELPILVVIDAMVRWLPGVLGHQASAAQDSFEAGLLDYPQYTRPAVVEGLSVPAVLLSGDHELIRRWRLKQQLGRTWVRRPDLLKRVDLDPEQQQLLTEFIDEDENRGPL